MKPKALVLRTAGTNCDRETAYAFAVAGAESTLMHMNHLKAKDSLSSYHILCIPGGFSYGDDLGAGKIFSLELLLWLRNDLEKFLARGGLILGICNGFQVLVKTGILPGVDFKQQVTLALNDSGRFEDRWVCLKTSPAVSPARSIWLNDLPETIHLPVAHAEGKFFASESVLDDLEKGNQIAFRYAGPKGETEIYPYNPNGSLRNIAGITDKSGRVLGLMPHPERYMFAHHHPSWHEGDCNPWGLKIFENAVKYCRGTEAL